VRYRLRPVRPRHRGRLRLTLATLLLPLIGIVVLTRLDVARRPFLEREAALAIGLQKSRRSDQDGADGPDEQRDWTSPVQAVVARLPKLASNRELQLRLAGMLAGSLALGLLVRLGTRLFAARAGIAVAVLLLALPTGRRLLGIELSVEPFYLATMLTALLAMRSMAETRIAAVFAGIATGLALVCAGLDAVWLPVMALAWLRVNQGLTWRSAGVIVGTTAATAAAALALGWLLYGRMVGEPLLPPLTGALSFLDASLLRPAPAARELIPLLPLVVVGLWTMRTAWWQSDSFRFLLLWLVLATASWTLSGAGASAYIAILLLACAIALLALEHARLLVSLPACGIALGLATMLWHISPTLTEAQQIDRWAVRETGRFVGKVIGPDRRIAAAPDAARRFAFYANRPVRILASPTPPFGDADYVILPRADYRLLRETGSRREKGARRNQVGHLRRIAEFGEWVILRQDSDD
jgi:hypothetical protein